MITVKVDAFELRKLILDTNMPITDDIWKFLNDMDLEYTDRVVFITKDGKELEYKKVITCKDCVRKSGCAIRMMLDFGDDFYCKYGSTNEDE